MKTTVLIGEKRAPKTIWMMLLLMQWLLPVDATLAADDCEVIRANYYEKVQGEIVTDTDRGYPYGRYRTVVYPCADVTVRDNYSKLLPRVVEITAVFTDKSSASKVGWCDKKSADNENVYFCIVCFESAFPISGVTCRFR